MPDGTIVAQKRWPAWSREEDDVLRRIAERGGKKAEVAAQTGRTKDAVAARAVVLRIKFRSRYGNDTGAKTVRRCLRCRNTFQAQSRVQFVCDRCHATEAENNESAVEYGFGNLKA